MPSRRTTPFPSEFDTHVTIAITLYFLPHTITEYFQAALLSQYAGISCEKRPLDPIKQGAGFEWLSQKTQRAYRGRLVV
jgi:hypothetical protein